MKSKNFRISDKEWEKFKELCSANDTDASKALREFIKKANKSNSLDYEFAQTSIYDFIESP